MMRTNLAALGVLLLAVFGCQAPAAAPLPTDTAVPVPASASVWGEVPKQCA